MYILINKTWRAKEIARLWTLTCFHGNGYRRYFSPPSDLAGIY